MLIFNTNIYTFASRPLIPVTYSQSWPGKQSQPIYPYKLFLDALSADQEFFDDLTRQNTENAKHSLEIFFPHASKFSDGNILKEISKLLREKLIDKNHWFKMNSYHFCYLYDSINNLVEEYCYSVTSKRLEMIPELNGNTIDFNWFLNTYFFHTAFLIDPERFNKMDKLKKLRLQEWSPFLFGVINHLAPSIKEIGLQKFLHNPYQSKKGVAHIDQDTKNKNLYGHGRGIVRDNLK